MGEPAAGRRRGKQAWAAGGPQRRMNCARSAGHAALWRTGRCAAGEARHAVPARHTHWATGRPPGQRPPGRQGLCRASRSSAPCRLHVLIKGVECVSLDVWVRGQCISGEAQQEASGSRRGKTMPTSRNAAETRGRRRSAAAGSRVAEGKDKTALLRKRRTTSDTTWAIWTRLPRPSERRQNRATPRAPRCAPCAQVAAGE